MPEARGPGVCILYFIDYVHERIEWQVWAQNQPALSFMAVISACSMQRKNISQFHLKHA